MKALKYMGPRQLEIQEEDIPEPKPGEVLLKVKNCGICGSDVHGYLGKTGRRIPPMTMGHEFSAQVAKLGKNATKFKEGDAVIVQPIHFCGECENCRKGMTNMCLNKRFFGVLTVNGAMAEYVAVPEKLLYPMPSNMNYEVGALTEPYAVAYGAVKKSGNLEGKNVLIIGAGTIGLCILQLVKLQKPAQVIVSDLSDTRLEVAKRLGANETINPKNVDDMETVARYTDGHMIDVSIEAVGVEATANQSIRTLRVGGTSVWVGMSQKEMEINMQDIVCSARRIYGSFNYTHKEFGEVVELISSGNMQTEKLISKTVGLEGVKEAMEDLLNRPDEFIKIMIDPSK